MKSETLSVDRCRFLTAEAREPFALIRTSLVKLIALPVSLIIAISCSSHGVHLSRPYVMIGFEEVDLFLEGLSSLEGELVYLSGDIEITRNEAGGYNYYTAVGYGIFSISGLEFNYSGKGLACDGATLDLSKGGLVVRADASIDSVYTLPLLAK